jgi:hypothetical protein
MGLAAAAAMGGTPTNDAYDYAYASGVIPGISDYNYLTPSIVLITDGQPTFLTHCEGAGLELQPVSMQPIVDDIAAAFDGSLAAKLPSVPTVAPAVKTFVIGSPGSQAESTTGADGRPWLSQAARAGGTARTLDCQDNGPDYCHFDLSQSTDFGADLAVALNDILQSVVPCTFQIPSQSNGQLIDVTKLNLVYRENVVGGQAAQQWLIGQTTDVSCAGGTGDGWFIDAASNIVLCSATCKTVQTDKYARLDVHGGCLPIAPPPT